MQVTLKDGSVLLGELVAREAIPTPGSAQRVAFREQFKVGNRDLFGADFRWVDETDIASRSEPAEATYVERREYGPLLGTHPRLPTAT